VAGPGDVDLSKIVKAIGVHEHRVFDVPSDRSLRRLQKRRGGPDKLGSRNVWWQASDWASAIINEMQMRRTLMSGAGKGNDIAAPAERPRSTSGRR
jgi:hypothetical protein